jgi:DNA invertase Pin-like site-specific DNA recombinase
VSTTEQSIDAQLERLADCEKVFHERLSGKKDDRPELARALEFVREGDQLVATRLDRLARSVAHLCTIAEALRSKHVELVILDQAIDTSTPAGKLLFHMLGAIAEFELSMRKEAQRAGIAHARAAGKPTGRQRKLSDDDIPVIRLRIGGPDSVATLAQCYKVSERTIRRVIAGNGCYAQPSDNRVVPADLPHEYAH